MAGLTRLYETKDLTKAALDETQRMLTQGGYAQLYPRTRRDAIISYGVVHQLPLGEINDKLFAEQEKTLF